MHWRMWRERVKITISSSLLWNSCVEYRNIISNPPTPLFHLANVTTHSLTRALTYCLTHSLRPWRLLSVVTQNNCSKLKNLPGNKLLRRAVDGIKHCRKRFPPKWIFFDKEVNYTQIWSLLIFLKASESKHLCAARLFVSFIILLQIQWPIESKFSQICYFMHNNMWGYTKWEYCL